MKTKTFIGIGLLAFTLFSCSKSDDATTDVASLDIELEEALLNDITTTSIDAKATGTSHCGNRIKPVKFKIKSFSMSSSIHLSYYGYSKNQTQSNGSGGRRKAKEGQVPGNKLVHFTTDSKAQTWYSTGYLASYARGKNNNGNKFHYALSRADGNKYDNTKQFPTWGSCSGAIFTKDITGVFNRI